jgi:sugar lactone lactonase YvrE
MSMPIRAVSVAIVLSVTASPSLAATPTPGPTSQPGIAFEAVTSPGAGMPFDLAVADLDGDGHLDLVSSNPSKDHIAVHRGDGSGRFAAPKVRRSARFPRGVALADFDGDGRLDVAVGGNLANAVAVHRGAPGGVLGPATLLPTGAHPFLLTARDLNGDRDPDIAVTLEGDAKVAILLNDGTGTFGAPSYLPVGTSPAAVSAADVNRDGTVDLAVACWGSDEVLVALGDGRGGFASPRRLTDAGQGLFAVRLEDLDGDELADVAWTAMGTQSIAVARGDGRGGFARTTSVPVGNGARSLVAVDLDGDGRLDLAGGNLADGTVSVALADGRGGWQPPQTVAVGQQPRVVVAGDFNGDGRPDLATSNMQSNDLTVLLNRGPATISLVPTPTPVETPPAIDASGFVRPNNIALDGRGHLYVSDQMQHRVARVDLATGAVTTVAGTGAPGDGGDGGPATQARLRLPGGVALDAAGDLYIADHGNNRVRRVDAAGVITTVAGTGEAGFSGDGGPATEAKLSGPFAVLIDADGNLVISDFGNARVRRVDQRGVISTILGTGIPETAGDGGPGTAASMRAASGLALHPSGDILVCEQYSMRIRRLGRDGIVTTFAGTGAQGSSGDGGPATAATFQYPGSVAAAPDGSVYVTDQDGNRVRHIAPDGTVGTLAGTGLEGYSGDGGPAAAARIWFPFGVAADRDGTVYFSDRYNNAIRRVAPDGIIGTVAGRPSGVPWHEIAATAPTPPPIVPVASDKTPALAWERTFFSGSDANSPYAVAAAPDGDLYVAGDVGSGADWVVERLAPDGTQRWRFLIQRPGVEIAYGLALSPDGGQIAVAGETAGHGKDAMVVALSTADGSERWRWAPQQEGHQVARAIAADGAGNLFVAGESNGEWEVSSLTPDGRLRWSVHDGPGMARGVDVDPQGNPVVVGDTRQLWRVDKRDGATGAALWQETVAPAVQHPDAAVAHAVRVDIDGTATITGAWTPPGGRTLRVERRHPNGAVLWAYIDPPGDADESGRAVALDGTGRAYVAGDTGTDWLVIALDKEGRPRWRLRHDGGGAAVNRDQATAIALVPPRDLFVAGIVHPLPAQLPSLGKVQWRLARYTLP